MSKDNYFVDSNNNKIHKTVIFGSNVSIGYGNYIGPYCVIHDDVSIKDGNVFESHCSVGSPAEHKSQKYNRNAQPQKGKVIIGSYNNFREFITINKPTEKITHIGDNCYIMRGSHVSHDTIVHNNVVMSCNVILGGHTQVLTGAYMGLNSCTHPRIIIGHYSMIGMAAVVTKNIPPVSKAYGVPAVVKGQNTVGIERNNIDQLSIKRFEKDYESKIQTEMF